MKYVNYFLILSAVVLVFFGLYFWMLKDQIDYAAFFIALSTALHAVYLHSTKSDKE